MKNVTNENLVFASKEESAICNSEDASFSDIYCNHEELWVAFGQSGKHRWLPNHKLVE